MEKDLRSEAFLHFVLNRSDVRVLCRKPGSPGGGAFFGLVILKGCDQFLGLPDAEGLFENAVGGNFLVFRRGQSQDNFGVAD